MANETGTSGPQSSLKIPSFDHQPLNPGGKGGDGGENPGKNEKKDKKRKGKKDVKGDDPDEPTIPKFNKKVSNKITTLSSKLTEIRCITTQLKAHSMCHAIIQTKPYKTHYFVWGLMQQL